jgi:hypothetical protein
VSDLTPRPEVPHFTFPAEYYEAPVTARPLFPRWVPLGCGWASVVLLLAAFIGGAVIMNFGVGKLMAMLVDTSHGEMKPMYATDVTPAKRAQVDAAIDQISHDLATDKLAYGRLEPLLTVMRDAMGDKRITNAEADQLLAKSVEVRRMPAKNLRPSPPAKNSRPSPGASRHPLPEGEGKSR